MKLEQKIKDLRKANNLTQEELGAQLYVTRNAVSKWESGRGIPSLDNLQSICKLFNISLDELVNESETICNNKRHLHFLVITSIIFFTIYLVQFSIFYYSMTLFLLIQIVIFIISSFIELIINTNKYKQKKYFFELYIPIIVTLFAQGIIGLLLEL